MGTRRSRSDTLGGDGGGAGARRLKGPAGRQRRTRPRLQHQVTLPLGADRAHARPVPHVLLIADPATTATDLTAGAVRCPHPCCGGSLAPWGWARPRALRIDATTSSTHTPQRGRCRRCRRTHVLLAAISYPRRPDSVETVGLALLAAASGLGHRLVAASVRLPATTVRGWLRRARLNAENVRTSATIAVHALDPMAAPLAPTGSVLADMVDAVGRAVQAAVVRLGPLHPPWQWAVLLTAGGILAPPRPPQPG